jgi:hypothetical protein
VEARFWIEQTPKGERAVRQTNGAAKKLTYARKMRIVDGDDGRTGQYQIRFQVGSQSRYPHRERCLISPSR